MRITLKTFADYRVITGIRETVLDVDEGVTMGALLERLTSAYPKLKDAMFDESGTLRDYIILLVNGRKIEFIGGMGTHLREGDVIALFPPVAGG